MKNILLCCNTMGIGGVETVILNQVVAYKRKGYDVFVIAGKGEYSNKVKECGGEFLEIDFPEENDINLNRVNKIVNIIMEKNITEIHIHKYQCIPSVFLAACITGIPYFAYEHGIKDTKKYYTWHYPIYKFLFPIFFENAYKIIAITPKVAQITKQEYGFSDEKYEIVHNGIDFNSYNNTNPNISNSIKKIFIVSRIDKEKLPTIYNGVEVFKIIKKIEPEAKLYIIGGGNAEEDVIDYLKKAGLNSEANNGKTVVKLLGKQTDIKNFLKDADILLGVGRCVLEAIAMKVPAIITGYDGINGLVNQKNINIAMEENFSGFNMSTIDAEECKKQVIELKENKIKIINDMYQIAKDNLDCYKNYINIPEKQILKIDWIKLFEHIKENNILIEKQEEDIRLKYEWIQKIENENRKLIEENKKLAEKNKELVETKEKMHKKNCKIIEDKEKRIENLEKERNEIYNSKRWRYIDKMMSIFHGKNKKQQKRG